VQQRRDNVPDERDVEEVLTEKREPNRPRSDQRDIVMHKWEARREGLHVLFLKVNVNFVQRLFSVPWLLFLRVDLPELLG
jgi:hypothetical protein